MTTAQPLPRARDPRPLLAAKLAAPSPPPFAVPRQRLHDLLRHNAGTRLTVVAAPAGWGKTTLLAHWLHDPDERRPVAWVSLDDADDEPRRFWTYVFSALQRIAPDVGSRALLALNRMGLDPVGVAILTLLNDLSDDTVARVLVLDDYHVITDARVHRTVAQLLGYLPPSLHLVVASRSDPPLPLARLRARGEITEIRMPELRFAPEEATSLVTAIAGARSSPGVAALLARTEGWAAGLQLAALTLRGAVDPVVVAAATRGDDRHILDFFVNEVLAGLAPAERDLLIRTSVLDRVSGPLCDAVLRRSGSADLLHRLDQSYAFVVPLDQHREWYRCHRLFRDVLQGLSSDAADPRSTLLTRAADWYLAQGQVDEAVAHHLLAGDAQVAAELLRSSVGWFVGRGAVASYLRLGERLPSATARADPALCVSLAWVAAMCGRFDRVLPWLLAAEPKITETSDPLDGWLTLRAAASAAWASYGQSAGDDPERALVEAERAVALETDSAMRGYVMARAALGGVLAGLGQHDAATPALERAWRSPARTELTPLLLLQTAGRLAMCLLHVGRAERARQLCAEVAPTAGHVDAHWTDGAAAALSVLRTAEGMLSLQDGDVSRARMLLRRAADLASSWGRPADCVTALTALAEAELACGDRAAAAQALGRARTTALGAAIEPSVADELAQAETRIGRGAVRAARRSECLGESLTDRELAVLRALRGPLSRREIAAELHLSLNTVKGYSRSLYRKLGVATRQEAVGSGHTMGLI